LNKRFIAVLFGALVGAMLIAGCGSSDNSETTASLTKAQFLKQGNAICKAGNEETNEGFESFSKEHNLGHKEPSEAQFEELSETVLAPSVSKQIEEVRALGTPEGDEGEVDEFLTNAEEALEKVEEEPALISAEGKEGPFYSVNKEAAAIGLTSCGGEEGEEEG
jgi:hypothetical protein